MNKETKNKKQNKEYKQWTFVIVSHRTSNCCTRKVRCPAICLPQIQGTQWQPGSSTSSNFPKLSLIARVDWSTLTQQKICPILLYVHNIENKELEKSIIYKKQSWTCTIGKKFNRISKLPKKKKKEKRKKKKQLNEHNNRSPLVPLWSINTKKLFSL